MENAAAWGIPRDMRAEELTFHGQELPEGRMTAPRGREWLSHEEGGMGEQRGEPVSNEAACTLMSSQRDGGREGIAMELGGDGGHVRVSFPLLGPTERYTGKVFGGRKARHS